MNNDSDDFLVEGVRRAGEIRDTLEAFERLMVARLEEILLARTSWVPLTGVNRTRAAHQANRGKQPSLVAWLDGELCGRHVNACAGIWWNSPAKVPTVLYAVVWDVATDRAVPVGTPASAEGLYVMRGSYIYSVPPPKPAPLNIEKEYERLLDAVLGALADPPGPKPTT